MKITRLPKIMKHRIFRGFTWPQELPAFAQFNVIYGWNGSGKTALSVLFEHIQNKTIIENGEIEFELDGKQKISGADLHIVANLPTVRVFNRNFISKAIEQIGESNVDPIYFLGEENIELQREVESLKTKLAEARNAVTNADSEEKKAKEKLDKCTIENAKAIKEALRGSKHHTDYDRRAFNRMAVKLSNMSTLPAALSDEQKEYLQNRKVQQAKKSIPSIPIASPDIAKLHSKTLEILEKSIASQLIEDLMHDPEIGRWVGQGLSLHKGDRKTDTCRFCGNVLSRARRENLEAHFNDDVKSFQEDINQAILDIKTQRQTLEEVPFPDESRFYDHLASKAHKGIGEANQHIRSIRKILDIFTNALNERKDNIFNPTSLKGIDILEILPSDPFSECIDTVNSIIEEHNTTTSNLDDEKEEACHKLEQGFVLDALPTFVSLTNDFETAKAANSQAKAIPAELENNISDIESKIIQHRRPAEELNRELSSYLGHDELKFEVKETGYALMRRGYPAQHLSEGERTAISFLYFLKSIEDKDFDMGQGIVVIDDPVSSLDSNALFSAFGYMKERTRDCHQLFILTHNFSFFRQVRDWFSHTKQACYYYLIVSSTNDERRASLSLMDSLLKDYQSEYHFLFKKVYDVATEEVNSTTELAQFYGVPNIARRVVEIFLAHRFPDSKGGLWNQLERVDFSLGKKTRILGLLNTYSHSKGISDSEHDLSVLAETRSVMKDILGLIQVSDPEHYKGMINLVQGTDPKD